MFKLLLRYGAVAPLDCRKWKTIPLEQMDMEADEQKQGTQVAKRATGYQVIWVNKNRE